MSNGVDREKLYRGCLDLARSQLQLPKITSSNHLQVLEEFWTKSASIGALGWCIPTEYGGHGHDISTTVRLLECLGEGCNDNGLTLALNGQLWSVQLPLLEFGSEQQKNRYLPRLCSGEIRAAHGMTEALSGSDAFSLQTRAEKVEDGYLLNGEKCYVGMAPCADLALVFARTDRQAGNWGLSAFLVDTDIPGVTRSDPIAKMGLNTNPMGNITLEDCLVPAEALLGGEGNGITVFNYAMEWERGLIFASHVGAMQRQIDQCISYAREREQFGKSISQFQAVSHRIAEMSCRHEMSQHLLYEVANLKDRQQNAVRQAAMAKLKISEYFLENSLDAIRVHGALGYLSDYEVEASLRDATGGVVYSGTSDIQRNIIAASLGL